MNQANERRILIDLATGGLLRDFRSSVAINLTPFVQGDTYRLRIAAVQRNPLPNVILPWQYVPLPEALFAAVVSIGAAPTSGTFTLTFGANTTAPIAYNASAATVATALNLLASITGAGGVAVAGPVGGPYQVAFLTAGARTTISGGADALYPLSMINVYTDRDGTVDLAEIQIIAIDRQPAALCETWEDFGPADITVETLQIGAAGVPEIQRVSINDDAYGGTYTLSFDGGSSAPIPFDASAEVVQAALVAMSSVGADNVVVTGAFPAWTVSFKGALDGDQPELSGNAGGLSVPIGKVGTFALNTGGIEQLVAGQSRVNATFEISAEYDGAPATILQEACEVLNDGIPNAPQTGTGLPSYYSAAAVDALLAGKINVSQAGPGTIGRATAGAGAVALIAPSSHIADAATDASTSHALSGADTVDKAALETALNALATKYNDLATKHNTLLDALESKGILA